MEICLGHSAWQAPVLVQLPKPSSSILATIALARRAPSTRPWGSLASDDTRAATKSMAEPFLHVAAQAPAADPLPEPLPPVSFDDFCKVEMTVVKVLTCEKVKKSEKLLKFTLDDGTGTPRQILSGIAKYYQPEELLGKTLVAVTNLPPRKMMGQESCGMLLSAERGDKLNLVMLDDKVPAGSRLV